MERKVNWWKGGSSGKRCVSCLPWRAVVHLSADTPSFCLLYAFYFNATLIVFPRLPLLPAVTSWPFPEFHSFSSYFPPFLGLINYFIKKQLFLYSCPPLCWLWLIDSVFIIIFLIGFSSLFLWNVFISNCNIIIVGCQFSDDVLNKKKHIYLEAIRKSHMSSSMSSEECILSRI